MEEENKFIFRKIVVTVFIRVYTICGNSLLYGYNI